MNDHNRDRRRFLSAAALSSLACAAPRVAFAWADVPAMTLAVRRQVRPDGKDYIDQTEVRPLDPGRTAILICDMWNQHWCASATRRCGAIAEKMAPLVEKARTAGVRIVHSPSDTLAFYKDHPARKRALAISLVEAPVKIGGWCSLEEAREGKLPIDDSDGGCDCQPQCKQGSPWTRQHPAIRIDEADFISDDGKQVYSYFKAEDIQNVLYMGVHTNMCVLGRSFGIRQMTRCGLKAVLVRDLTDTMYNPRKAPFVPHDEGTELVIRHVERHWCPTVDSAALLTGLPG